MSRQGFKFRTRKTGKSTGFTLLELMIGLIIVTVLASLAVPSFTKALEKTKVKDAETALAAIYSAEKVYRLDQNRYGPLKNLVAHNYITDPQAGNTTWNFTDNVADTTFTVTAQRTGGSYDGKTITVDQNFSGQSNPSPGYNGRIYRGNHGLRD